MSGKVLIDDSQDSKNILALVAALEELVVNPKDSLEEFSSEREVEFGIFTDEFSDQGKYVKHTKFEVLVLGIVLSM